MTDRLHIINFSGGRSSGLMLDILLKQNPETSFKVVFCNTAKETPETYRFVKRVQEYYGIQIVVLEWMPKGVNVTNIDDCKKNGEVFESAIAHRKGRFLPNVAFRWCTDYMKVRAIKRWVKGLGYKAGVNYIGIRFDEPQRYSRGISNNSGKLYKDYPLYYNEVTKADVDRFWKSMPFDLEHNSLFGNCDLCFLKGKAKKVKILRQRPESGKWWLDMEEKTGYTFSKNISVKDLYKLAAQPEFDFEPMEEEDIICNCTID